MYTQGMYSGIRGVNITTAYDDDDEKDDDDEDDGYEMMMMRTDMYSVDLSLPEIVNHGEHHEDCIVSRP